MSQGNPLDVDALEAAGIHVATVNTKISGATTRLARPLAVGQRVVIVADCVVEDVGLKGPAAEVRLGRALKANELYDLEPDAGARVLSALREASAVVDTTKGHEALPGIVGRVDASGVVITEAERAAVNGESPSEDQSLTAALAWARENFGQAFESDAEDYLAALDEVSEFAPWAIRYLILVEDAGDAREDVIAALETRLEEERARSTTVPPWDTYAKDSIDAIRSRIEAVRIESTDAIRWHEFLGHVEDFEMANKNRKGVLDFIATFVAADDRNEGAGDDDEDLELEDKAE